MLEINPHYKALFKKNYKNFNDFMQLHGTLYRKVNKRTTEKISLEGQALFIKKYHGIGWIEIFKNLLQGKLPILGASLEWRALQRLAELKIPVANWLAYGKLGVNPAKQHSFVLMSGIEDAISLEDLCNTMPQLSFRLKRKLIYKVATITRTLHQNNINHRDLYLCHFLWKEKQDQLYLIDLHRVQMHKRLPLRWRIKDLAALYFSSKDSRLTQRDYFYFLAHYHELPLKQILKQYDKLWHLVIQRGEKLYREHN